MGSRDLALAVVRDVFGPQRRGAQASFAYRCERFSLSPRDRAFAAELAYGAIKMRRTLDYYLKPYLAARTTPLPAAIAEVLRLGVYQLRFMHGVSSHAAVFETVGAALRVGHRGTAGLVNAVLRRFIGDAPHEPQPDAFADGDEYLGTRFSLPDWVVASWRERFGDRLEAIVQGVDAPPQLALCAYPPRASREEVAALLAQRDVVTRPSAFATDALIVEERPDTALGDDQDGRWLLQSESACMPVDLLAPQPGESVVDLCSGRGNKAVQIAGRLAGEGRLECVEIDERRAQLLRERLLRREATNVAVVCADATQLRVEAETDAVLVDAPCSGLGIVGRHPEARWRKRPADGARLAEVQYALLQSAAARVRHGGRLVYAVCSTDPRECEAVVDRFLGEAHAFARAALPLRYDALRTAAGDVLVPPGIERRDGFYVASLQRSG